MEQIDNRTAASVSQGYPRSNRGSSGLSTRTVETRTFRDGQSWTPLISQNVEADAAVGVDVGVVDASGEVDLWGLERVVGREMNREEEDTTRVWRVTLCHVNICSES